MKTQKQIITGYFKEFELKAEDLKRLQEVLFMMLKDFKSVCEKYGLNYMLCGGTLLGAVRHKGFIPWDDDIDVMMPRCDAEKIKGMFETEFPDKYEVVSAKYTDCPFRHIKIMLKGTKYVEIGCENMPYFQGVFLDIFIIENMPKGKRRLRGKIFDFAFHAAVVLYELKHPSNLIRQKEKEYGEVKKFFSFRRNVARVLRIFFGYRFYLWLSGKLANYKKETGIVGIPLAIAYNREVFPHGILLGERVKVEFCGELFDAPNGYDTYLKNLYRDYMTLPPEEKREKHYVSEIDFGKYTAKE